MATKKPSKKKTTVKKTVKRKVAKKPSAPKKAPAPAGSKIKQGIKSFFNKYPWMIAVVFFGSLFGYNKFLDWRQIQDMKQLVSDFEQLEQDLERETGEEFVIEAECSSGVKFSTSYSCSIYLKNDFNKLYDYRRFIEKNSSLNSEKNRCSVIDGEGALYLNFYSCTASIRDSNKAQARNAFAKYRNR